eukprot:gene12345-8473_t
MALKRPREPGQGECCGNGCPRCVWDVYYDQLQAYELQSQREKEQGVTSFSEEESEESEDDDDVPMNYIGSVVVRWIPRPPPEAIKSELDIVHSIDSTLTPIHQVSCLDKTTGMTGSQGSPPIYILRLLTASTSVAFLPGDAIEVFVPNNIPRELDQDLVREVCTRLKVNPDQWCELHRSPFVPENHFPPWLPLREPITVRNLLTYFVDLSSNAFLHPNFFQTLLRLYRNQRDKRNHPSTGSQAAGETPTKISPVQPPEEEEEKLLRTFATPSERATEWIRRLAKGGGGRGALLDDCCYPTVCDLLEVFSSVTVPLDRFLEMTCRLLPRTFSVVQQYSLRDGPSQMKNALPEEEEGRRKSDHQTSDSGQLVCTATEICIRETRAPRSFTLLGSRDDKEGDPREEEGGSAVEVDKEDQVFACVLRRLQAAVWRRSPQPFFFGHASLALTSPRSPPPVHLPSPSPPLGVGRSAPRAMYAGTAAFGRTTFAKCLSAAVTPSLRGNLTAAGTGSAPSCCGDCCSTSSQRAALCLPRKLYLMGMGTGMAPLMAAVYALYQEAQKQAHEAEEVSDGERRPGWFFDCTVWYGARTLEELVFHAPLRAACTSGAIAAYRYAVSRATEDEEAEVEGNRGGIARASSKDPENSGKRYITELLEGADEVRRFREELWLRQTVLTSTPFSSPLGSSEGIAGGDDALTRLIQAERILFDEWNSWHFPSPSAEDHTIHHKEKGGWLEETRKVRKKKRFTVLDDCLDIVKASGRETENLKP